MDDCRHYLLYPSDLNFFACFTDLQVAFRESSIKEVTGCSDVRYRVQAESSRSLQARDFKDFLKLLQKHPVALPILIHSHWKTKNRETVFLGIRISSLGIKVDIEADDLITISAFHDHIRDIFRASNPEPERNPEPRLWNLKKSVFLAHRFDDKGNLVAAKLTQFLRRLGFDVLEGSGYEARSIPEKVADRIRAQDIFICLVTEGNPTWILSEAAFSKGLNKFLIIVCQQGVRFDKGIIGEDYEHLLFSDDRGQDIYSELLLTLPR